MSLFTVGCIVERVGDSWEGCKSGGKYEVTAVDEDGNLRLKGLTKNYAPDKFILKSVVTEAIFKDQESRDVREQLERTKYERDAAEATVLLCDYKLEYLTVRLKFLEKEE